MTPSLLRWFWLFVVKGERCRCRYVEATFSMDRTDCALHRGVSGRLPEPQHSGEADQ